MGIATLHTLGSVKVGVDVIGQIQSHSWSPGVDAIVQGGSGSIDRLMAAAGIVIPAVSFTTTDIGAAINDVGVDGESLASNALALFYTKRTIGGQRSTTDSTSITFALGVIAPTTLSADLGGATLGYAAIAYSSDGASSPIAYATGVTVPAASNTYPANTFVVGDCTVGGVTVSNVVDASVDFGLNLDARASNGEIYPTFAGIVARAPSMVIHTTDISWLNSHGGTAPGGTAPADTSTVVLDEVAIGGSRSAGQIIVTAGANDHHVYITSANATHNGDAVVEIMITPIFDGSNDPLIVSGAAVA